MKSLKKESSLGLYAAKKKQMHNKNNNNNNSFNINNIISISKYYNCLRPKSSS
jgi:hypothetical protein